MKKKKLEENVKKTNKKCKKIILLGTYKRSTSDLKRYWSTIWTVKTAKCGAKYNTFNSPDCIKYLWTIFFKDFDIKCTYPDISWVWGSSGLKLDMTGLVFLVGLVFSGDLTNITSEGGAGGGGGGGGGGGAWSGGGNFLLLRPGRVK